MPLFEKHPALTRRETGLEAVAVGSGEAPHAPATKHLALRAVARSERGAGAVVIRRARPPREPMTCSPAARHLALTRRA